MRKVQKVESAIIQNDCETMSKKRTNSFCVYTQCKSTKGWRALIQRMITKERVKNEQMNRKKTCSVCFVKVIKFQENKFKILNNNF